jgi:hypothetical protein
MTRRDDSGDGAAMPPDSAQRQFAHLAHEEQSTGERNCPRGANAESKRQLTLLASTNATRTFYHFTSSKAATKIVNQGLKANWVTDMPKEHIGPMRGVWLTDNPRLPPMFSRSAEYRIEVAIPHTDMRLFHWRSMLLERLSPKQLAGLDLETPDWKSFYFYSGNVDAVSIRGCERYATLSAMKACRKAHFERLKRLGIE